MMALRCLVFLISAVKTKKINENGSIQFILNVVPVCFSIFMYKTLVSGIPNSSYI